MSIVVALISGILVFLAVHLSLTTWRRDRVRRRMSPFLVGTAAPRPPRDPSKAVSRVVSRVEHVLTRLGLHRRIALRIERAGFDVTPGTAVSLTALLALGVFALLLGSTGFVTSLLCATVAAAAPWIVLQVLALRRSRAFERQLPEVLDTLAASLRAGHGFDHGLQTVATDVAEPAAREFGRVVAEVHLGRALEEALLSLSERIKSPDLRFVIDAVAIQRQVGGSLAELFELVAKTVRAREQFRRNLRAITGMVRTSANVLTFLPFAAAVLLTLVNPDYMAPLWHTSSGHVLALVGLGMVLAGSVVLRRVGAVKS
jgi:tight adherence protein B